MLNTNKETEKLSEGDIKKTPFTYIHFNNYIKILRTLTNNK